MKKIITAGILFLFFSRISAFDGYYRHKNYDIIHYEFAFRLTDSSDTIVGRALIVTGMTERSDSVTLDLEGLNSEGKGMTVDSVLINAKVASWTHRDNRITIFSGDNSTFKDTLSIAVIYHGIPSGGLIISRNKFGDRTFFADNWPDRAHCYIPCIDHPYDKATVDFIIIAPECYSVVANGRLIEESSIDNHLRLTHWSESVPLPVKVMTFGAARFATGYAGDVHGVPVWSWVFPQNRTEGFSDYSIATRPLAFYDRIIGSFPFEKLANVQSKTTYGGLENASAIFYSENSVTGKGRAEGLIAHEEAHQWFGDCVTEADWHHIWLSEGFATYLTSFYMESVYGKERLKSDMKRTREMVIRAYNRKPAPVVDTTITNLMDLLSINSYQKGAWILHMLRNEIGDSAFVSGLRLFYNRYMNSNVLSCDFQNDMEEVSGRDLGKFFEQWLYVAGQPELQLTTKHDMKTGSTTIFIEQKQDHLFEFTLELLIRTGSGERIEKTVIRDRVTRIIIPAMDVKDIIPDPDVKLLFSEVKHK